MKKSFTLIELLIVIIIIGILATLAIPQYQKMIQRAQAAEAKQVLSALANSAWRYYIEAGSAAPQITDLDVQPPVSKYYSYSYEPRPVSGPPFHDGFIVIAIVMYPSSIYRSYSIQCLPLSGGRAPYPEAANAEKKYLDDKWYLYYERDELIGGYNRVIPNWNESDNQSMPG